MVSAFIIGGRAEATTCKPASLQVKEAAWRAYRARFPFLMQGIARMQGEPGCTVVVIGEPPPAFQVAAMLASIDAAEQPADVMIRKHDFGGDGWTKDVVFTIDGGAPEAETISLLHQHVFGTSFRAWTIDLDAPAPPAAKVPLDLQVTPSDLRAWLFSGKLAFTSVVGGGPRSARQLLGGAPGVYESANPNLVAWVIDTEQMQQIDQIDARQFAMASDLVLGATLSDHRLVVIGRSRIAPFEVIPPLRIETIRLLARADRSLAQSYERDSPLAGSAGKNNGQPIAWAPIYLSSELIDTELGSLLNLTDQLLKSWSNAGKTRYLGFAYPDPSRWPFGDRSVIDHLRASSVTYNWNTKDFATLLINDQEGVVAFHSTGALPLDYLLDGPAPSVEQASAVGRKYFAGLGDPNLVRVVQYSALYHELQLARAMGSRDPTGLGSWFARRSPAHTDAVVDDIAATMATAFAHASDPILQQLVEQEFDEEMATNSTLTPEMKPIFAMAILAIRHSEPFEDASDADLRALAKQWSSPPSLPTKRQQKDRERYQLIQPIMQRLVGVERLHMMYLDSHPDPADGWIHTSTWVTSTTPMLLGGHNLEIGYNVEERPIAARRYQEAMQIGSQPVAVPTVGGWSSASGARDRAILDAYGASRDGGIVRLVRTDTQYIATFGDRPQAVKATTLADAQDAISSVLRTQDKTQPVQIHLQGFSGEQARVFRDQIERVSHLTNGILEINIVTFRGEVTLAQAKEMARKERFQQVEVNHVEPMSSLPNVVESNVTHADGKLRTLFARIRVQFRDAVTEPVRARVRKIIDAVCAKLGPSGTWTRTASRLRRDLDQALRREGLNATVELANESDDRRVVEVAHAVTLARS